MNHNQLLGVSHDASPDEIKKAFRVAAMEIHPDHSSAPEAAEAFARIKAARDELLERAEQATVALDSQAVQYATDAAVRATANAAFQQPVATPVSLQPTAEEIRHIQELDRLAMEYTKQSFLSRAKESDEARRHRRTLRTAKRRIEGRY